MPPSAACVSQRLDGLRALRGPVRRRRDEERIKGLCGAKPPQKPCWTNAVGFGGSIIRYGDFTSNPRCRGRLVRLSPRLPRVATASSRVRTAVSEWPASSFGSRREAVTAWVTADPHGVTGTRQQD